MQGNYRTTIYDYGMIARAISQIRAAWNETAIAEPPHRTRWDYLWLLVAIGLTVADLIDQTSGHLLLISPTIAAGAAVMIRRRHIWATIGLLLAVSLWDFLVHAVTGDFSRVGGMSLLFIYSVVRWGSGRQIVAMTVSLLPSLALAPYVDADVELYSAALVMAVLLVSGYNVRQRANIVDQRLRAAQLDERQRIARELHDSVAHHVSGISVQARAATALITTNPEAAAEAMEAVRAAASDALAEMRRMVAALRDDDVPDLRPQAGLNEIIALGQRGQTAPRVEVRLSGELDNLEPALAAGLFRLAQESVTNASRHARQASVVAVRVVGRTDRVILVVDDDGDTPISYSRDGFGLVGMRERAVLLGGTFEAGPKPQRGWRVAASLPRE